ncbi:hypothetical protein DB345_11240 [Spartobacteria bacterium LR76]|nr:hypothetical protein DB345_11240 [Spartobacteria bacterium LR76]
MPEVAPLLSSVPDTAKEKIAVPVETAKPVDPLIWLLEHKERAPKEIILQHPAKLWVSVKGKEVGFVTFSAGVKAQVVRFDSESVEVRVEDAVGEIPVDATNIQDLAKAEQEKSTIVADVHPSTTQRPSVKQAVEFPTPRFETPGVILNRADLETVKTNLDREPWKSGFAALVAEGRSKLDYKMAGPFEEVKRAPNVNLWPWRNDMSAIWNLSLMWYFTGDTAYAQKAHDILLAWAKTHTSFGGRESMLDLGDYAAAFVGGADILRGTWPGWTAADTATVKKYFNDVLIPASNPYGESMFGAANKGALALVAKGLMAIFNEDTPLLKTVVYQIRTLAHIGLRSSNDIGMLGDSLRDQGHAHGQLLSLAMLAEALWKQGIDIYSDYDNRLLAAGEYFARINALTPTTFIPFGTTDAYYLNDNTNHGWGGGNVALNLIHGAYVVRKRLPAPCTDRSRQSMPVRGGSFMFIKETDSSEATPMLPPPIPATVSTTTDFSNVDIGGAAPAGSASYSDGIWKVRGGGADIWKAADSCHFTYKVITGDCAIVAKVESVGDTSPSAKAGVMMRTSLSESASRAWMAISGGNIEQNMPNLAVYGGTNYGNKVLARSVISYWVKLERIGNIITGYVSPDGTNWAATDVGRIEEPVPPKIYLGLVVCSAVNGTLNTSTFRNVQITGGDGRETSVTPSAPSALLTAPGDGAVVLRWQASFGANTYTIKRAASMDGPFEAIASGITATSFIDATVENGVTFRYVVSAVNSAGESPNSPEDDATPRAAMWNVALGGKAAANIGEESAANAFDSNSNTLWFAGGSGGAGTIQYDFGSNLSPVIGRYTITSPSLKPERDPKDWQLQGSDDGMNWTTLDTQSAQMFPFRCYEMEYALSKPAAYRFFRLNVTANNGDKDLHVADIKLLSDTPMQNAPMPSMLHWRTNEDVDRVRALALQKARESQK